MIHQRVSSTIGINGLVGDACYIGEAKRVYLELQTYANGIITATANIHVQVAMSDSDTFRRVQEMGVYSANSGIYDWEIPSMAGHRVVLCRPVVGYNWLKVESTKTATAAYTCFVHIIR